MKRIISILFISIFLFNYLGFYLTFNIEQYFVKSEIKRKLMNDIPNSELAIITIYKNNQSQLSWYDDHKEFSYNHKMYDVVRTKSTDSTTVYYCIEDNKESKLNKKLEEHVETNISNNPVQKSKASDLIKKITNDGFFFTCISFKTVNVVLNVEYSSLQINYSVACKDVIDPPPRFGYLV